MVGFAFPRIIARIHAAAGNAWCIYSSQLSHDLLILYAFELIMLPSFTRPGCVSTISAQRVWCLTHW